eukprot:6669531-Pyramimonas_sp.AAC.1
MAGEELSVQSARRGVLSTGTNAGATGGARLSSDPVHPIGTANEARLSSGAIGTAGGARLSSGAVVEGRQTLSSHPDVAGVCQDSGITLESTGDVPWASDDGLNIGAPGARAEGANFRYCVQGAPDSAANTNSQGRSGGSVSEASAGTVNNLVQLTQLMS